VRGFVPYYLRDNLSTTSRNSFEYTRFRITFLNSFQHCALSLVGEPIMYPQINKLVNLLHQKRISSFLVTNAQFPDAIRFVHLKSIRDMRQLADLAVFLGI